jgi:hypothetical protein
MDIHSQADGTITPPHRGPGLALNWFLGKIRSFEDGFGHIVQLRSRLFAGDDKSFLSSTLQHCHSRRDDHHYAFKVQGFGSRHEPEPVGALLDNQWNEHLRHGDAQ